MEINNNSSENTISMENKYCVYFHKKADSGEIFYVGIGNSKRPYTKKGRSDFWKKVVNKYGLVVEIVHENLTWDEACKFEIKYITQFGRIDLKTGSLVNMTCGADGRSGSKPSLESRKKMSDIQKVITNTPEVKLMRSEFMKARQNLPEVKLKMSEFQKERQNQPEVKQYNSIKIKDYWESGAGLLQKEYNKTEEAKIKNKLGLKKYWESEAGLLRKEKMKKKTY